MEKSFDFDRLLKSHENHEKKHKSKPAQFVTVAGGVQKRLENNLKNRKSSRLTVFDKIRNLSRCESPVAVADVQSKVEHRRLQLEKWKEEKEKRKKEAAAQKKKPFVAGVAHTPLMFVPPPPPPKAMPSTSGRVTRSQTAKQNMQYPKGDTKQTKTPMLNPKGDTKQTKTPQSFAPKNATFKPPQIKNLTELPKLAPVKKTSNKNKVNCSFNPIVHSTRQRTINTKPADNKMTKTTVREVGNKTNGRVTKRVSSNKVNKLSKALQSSSSSEIESTKISRSSLSSKVDSASSLEKSPVDKLKTPRKSLPKNAKLCTPKNQMPKSESSSEDKLSSKVDSASSLEKSPVIKLKTPRKSSPKDTKLCTLKNQVPKSESSSEEKLRSPKSLVDIPITPEQIAEEAKNISPCVTMSRGKDNARKEMKKKIDEGLLDDDASNMESVDHFRRQLNSEIKRMTEMCEVWDKILEQTPLSESVQELVRTAVGQARLLMGQKLQQFAGLVERCGRPAPGAPLVTPADLHGFWDMVFMQVENIDMRFKKLEELRARNWVEDHELAGTKPRARNHVTKPARPTTATTTTTTTTTTAATTAAGRASRLREMIAAARKAKKDQQIIPASPKPAPAAPTGESESDSESKTFEAGFFCVRSPVRSPAHASVTHTPNNKTLLKAVLSSEAKKSASKNSTSFAMLRASTLSKNVDHEGIALLPQTPLTPINFCATPGRSILKSANVASEKKAEKKSLKIVLFDDSDNNIDENNLNNTEDVESLNISGVNKLSEVNADSGLSPMDVEKEEQKENRGSTRRKSKLVRQDATTEAMSSVMTRSRRKSLSTPLAEVEVVERTPRKSARRKKALRESENNVIEEKNTDTPKRSVRKIKVKIYCK